MANNCPEDEAATQNCDVALALIAFPATLAWLAILVPAHLLHEVQEVAYRQKTRADRAARSPRPAADALLCARNARVSQWTRATARTCAVVCAQDLSPAFDNGNALWQVVCETDFTASSLGNSRPGRDGWSREPARRVTTLSPCPLMGEATGRYAMKIRQKNHGQASDRADNYHGERPPADEPEEALSPQPEQAEPRLPEPGPTDLSKRDYLAIVRRALRRFSHDHMTNIAAALAYYAFLAIPSALMVGVGVFSLVAGPHAISTVIGKLHTVMPGQATSLLEGSLKTMTHHRGTAISVLSIGGVLALWSLTGAMQNIMWATNIAYDREEGRGFVRRRITALGMVVFALIGFALVFGVLVLGPHLSNWIGNAAGAKSVVKIVWWIAEWPLLVGGLLVAFAGLMFLAPNVKHPRWKFLTFGAIVAIAIWLVASGAFAIYASKFGSYNKTWGSLSAVVVMLTWLWLSGAALLLGAEVNAEAERSRELRRGEPAEVDLQTPAKS
jgi:membrane protein